MGSRRAALVAGLLAFALVAGACGDDGQEAEPAAESPAVEDTSPAPVSGAGEIDVQAEDYDFRGTPANLPAGPVTFTFENVGKELHEMVLLKSTTGKNPQEILALPENKARKLVEEVGVTFAMPGKKAKRPVEAELSTGLYFMVCFVPVGTTPQNKNAKGPPHFTKGMIDEFTVE